MKKTYDKQALITLSVITKKGGQLTKTISLNEDGEIVKDANQCFVSKGYVKTIHIPVYEFVDFLRGVETNQALIHGVSNFESVDIVAEKDFKEQPNTITRTKRDFSYPTTPGILMFDVDGPVIVNGQELTIDKIIDQIQFLCPGLEGSYMVTMPSVSSGIHKHGESPPPITGWHIYIFVENPSDIPRFAKVLNIKIWTADLGTIKISKSGSMLIRNALIDMAVFSPERLDFIAPPVLDEGLERTCPQPELTGNKFYDTSLLQDPSSDEHRQYAQAIEKAKENAQEEASRVRAEYDKLSIKKLMDDGVSRAVARKMVAVRHSGVLTSPDRILFDGGGQVSVGEILSDPEQFQLQTCHDPIEPEKGPCKAKIFVNDDDSIIMHSFARGGCNFTLVDDYQSLDELIESKQLDIEEVMVRVVNSTNAGVLSNVEQESLLGKIATIYNVGKRAVNNDFKSLKAGTLTSEKATEDLEKTHHDMATDFIDELSNYFPPYSVAANGLLYTYRENCWKGIELTTLHGQIAARFNRQSKCQRKGDYRAITQHIYDLDGRTGFFENSPSGIAFNGYFARIDGNGEITKEQHSHNHRRRSVLSCDPKEGPMPLFWDFLRTSLSDDDYQAQVDLLQEVVGAILAGIMHRYHKVLLLKGNGRNGKGVFSRLLKDIVPAESITAVSPFDWTDQHKKVELAGKMLNLVGELPGDKPIPASEFKNVTGGDDLIARFLYQNPFRFRSTAAHVFSSNHFIRTRDHSHAFYERWILVEFSRTIKAADRIPGLAQKIAKTELPQILNWALEGAQRVIRNNGFTLSTTHHSMMSHWRLQVDSVAAFLEDEDWVKAAHDLRVKRSVLYSTYVEWCGDCGYIKVGRNKFHDRVENYSHDGVEHPTRKSDDIYFMNLTVLK